MVIIVRIELDDYSLKQIDDMVRDQVITIPEARMAKAFTEMSDVHQLFQVRKWQTLVRIEEGM